MRTFFALELSIESIPILRTRDPGLHKQIRAAGSAAEVEAALRVAIAWGDLDEAGAAPAFQRLDRLLGMLYRLSR